MLGLEAWNLDGAEAASSGAGVPHQHDGSCGCPLLSAPALSYIRAPKHTGIKVLIKNSLFFIHFYHFCSVKKNIITSRVVTGSFLTKGKGDTVDG
jgi:hypothetical protein